MRPRPSEVIDGVRRILRDTIAPELTSDHARGRLGEVRAVLAQVDWDNAGFALAARNERLRAGLREAGARISIDVPGPAGADDFDAHQRAYEALAGALIEALGQVRNALIDTPDDPELLALRDRLIALA